MSEGSIPNSWREAIPAVIWVVLISSFGLLFIESLGQLFKDPFYRAFFALSGIVGLLSMLIYRRWLLERFKSLSGGSVLAAIIATLFVLALSPYVEQQRWPFASWLAVPVPSADEIAEAVVHALPKSNSTALASPPAVVTQQPESPNPLRPESVKWRATTGLVDRSKKENLKCKVLIVRNPLSYAEDYAADLKPILETARWDYEVSLATGELQKGLSALVPSESGIKRQCAEAFLYAIMSSRDNGWPAGNFLSWQDETHPFDASAKDCPNCFQVGIGNPGR